LLDLGLPDRDDLEILPQLVAAGVAVVVLSARDATAERSLRSIWGRAIT
jgi:two-component system KDP operon response regulator KdpE